MVRGIDSGDFINFALKDLGVSINIIHVNEGFTSNGDKTPNNDSPTVSVTTAVYNPKITEFTQQKLGLQEETDAYIMLNPTVSIKKDDKIQVQGREFEVIDVRERLAPANNTSIYKFCQLHFIGDL